MSCSSKLAARNSQLETRSSKLAARNSQLETRSSKLETNNIKQIFLNNQNPAENLLRKIAFTIAFV